MLNNDYAQFAPPLLALAGFLYQWLRQYGGVKERWTYVYAGALAAGVYLLCYDFHTHVEVQLVIIRTLLWVSGNTATVLGGTFAASGVAKSGLAVNTGSGIVPLVPMTNSK